MVTGQNGRDKAETRSKTIERSSSGYTRALQVSFSIRLFISRSNTLSSLMSVVEQHMCMKL